MKTKIQALLLALTVFFLGACSASTPAPEPLGMGLGDYCAQQSGKVLQIAPEIEKISVQVTTLAMTEPALFVYGCDKLIQLEQLSQQLAEVVKAWKENVRTSDLNGTPKTCQDPLDSWFGISQDMLKNNPLN